MEQKIKKILNARGIVSIVMFISLFLQWYQMAYVSRWNAYQSAFRTAQDSGLMWLIIIFTIILVLLNFITIQCKAKSIIFGGISTIILILNIIIRLILIPECFKKTLIGWKLMTLLCIIQIIISLVQNKNEVKKIVSDGISQI